jgi:filamentous hemagglutinin
LQSEVEAAEKARAECADQACRDRITALMEKTSLDRDYGREQFGNQYFQDIGSNMGC